MIAPSTATAAGRATASLLGAQQRALVGRIATANAPGNLEGLFAFHAIGQAPTFPLVWMVNPGTPAWLADHAARATEYPVLAAMGYGLRHFAATAPPDLRSLFAEGMGVVRRRTPFPDDRISFAYQPLAFLGLAFGAVALGDAGETFRAWLVGVLDDPRRSEPTLHHALLYAYARHALTGEARVVDNVDRYVEADELALLLWCHLRGAVRLADPRSGLSALQARVLEAATMADERSLDAPRAAVVWSAVHTAVERGVGEIVLSGDHIALVLRRFEAALRRWRWDDPARVQHPVQWPITAEREVQDVLWLVLRSLVDDVVDEETLPRLGHSTYRADFGIPSLRLLIEAKYCRHASDFKAIEKEIMEDASAYLALSQDRYDRILVFIYDQSSSVQEHDLTASALRTLPQIEDVIIASRPSQLPA